MPAQSYPSLPDEKDAQLPVEEIIGTRTFENVLYRPARAEDQVPVNVLTGEKTANLPPAEIAWRFAEETGDNRVAVPRNTESIAETGGSAYISTFFADSKVVRGKRTGRGEYGMWEYENGDDAYALEWTYRAAWMSDDYEVSFDPDYQTGDVTITVEVAGDGDSPE